MNHGIVENFRRLATLNTSDFHGLISPGLTCYLNSVLQVLFMTENFRDRIKRLVQRCSQDARTLDTHLEALFTNMEKNKARTHDITQILGIQDVYEQRDAAEYFEKILRLTSPKASEMFKGELNHVTICRKCEKINNASAFFWILPLSIKDPHETYRVDKGLEIFFREEKVSYDNKMFCTQCDKKQDAIIRCEMMHLPDVLTLLLKRFHFDHDLKCNIKVDCEAEVPHTLQIKGCSYELYAMVKHYGNLSGGHYIAFIYSFQTKEWYYFNDERVKLMSNFLGSGKAFVRSRSCYLLMYMKMSRDSKNTSENKDDAHSTTANAEAGETHVAVANQLMKASCNGFGDLKDEGQVDNFMFSEKLRKGQETVMETVRLPSPVSQRKLNSPKNSTLKAGHRGEDSKMLYQDRFARQISHGKGASIFNTVHTSDFGVDQHIRVGYSPITNKSTDFKTMNVSPKSTKGKVSKASWK